MKTMTTKKKKNANKKVTSHSATRSSINFYITRDRYVVLKRFN